MTRPFNPKRSWVLVVAAVTLGCSNDKPHPGAQGGSAGAEFGGSEAGGSAGANRGGAGGSTGGGTTIPCPEEPSGGGGAGHAAGTSGIAGEQNRWPDGAPCHATSLYCIAKDARTCVCTGGSWLCFGGVDPIDSTETVLTGAYRGEDNQACATCAEAHCLTAQQWPCDRSGSPHECLHLLACELESGCPRAENGVKSCYCGSADPASACLYTNDANGICRREESTVFTAPLTALTNYFNPSSSSGAANSLAACLAENCASCFRANEQNLCPTVSALSVDVSVAVGRPGQLRALASDPDQAPDALSYAWSVRPAEAGVIADPNAANTVFNCASPGRASISVQVSDGDPACDFQFSRSVYCQQPLCQFEPLGASARAAFVGESITLSLAPPSSGPLQVEWSSIPVDLGTLSAVEPDTATYTCMSAGIVTVTANTTQGGCTAPLSLSLTCTTPDSPAAQVPQSTESALTRAYLGQNNEACWNCAQASPCLDPDATLPCELRSDPAERALCLRLLQCELESGCATEYWSCYCKSADSCFIASDGRQGGGVCSTQIENALQTTDPSAVGSQSGDPTLPGAPANLLTQCLAASGCSSCFPAANQ